MTDRILRCLLGDPLLAASYRNNLLNSHDRHRIEHAPQLAERTDWKVSRALKQLADSPVVSLSHSKGFAALLCTDCPPTIVQAWCKHFAARHQKHIQLLYRAAKPAQSYKTN